MIADVRYPPIQYSEIDHGIAIARALDRHRTNEENYLVRRNLVGSFLLDMNKRLNPLSGEEKPAVTTKDAKRLRYILEVMLRTSDRPYDLARQWTRDLLKLTKEKTLPEEEIRSGLRELDIRVNSGWA